MTIQAKFKGTCTNCGDRFDVGTPIVWTKGAGSRHVTCPGIGATPVATPAPTTGFAGIPDARVAVASGVTVVAPTPLAVGPVVCRNTLVTGARALPTFDPRSAGEGWTAYGRRALLFVLSTDLTYCLDDAGLEAAADAVSTTQAAGLSPEALDRLTAVQAMLRGLLRGRQAVAALEATPAPVAVPDAVQAVQGPPPAAPGGGGGAKVPRRPKPAPQAPPAARVPVPVGTYSGLSAEDAF